MEGAGAAAADTADVVWANAGMAVVVGIVGVEARELTVAAGGVGANAGTVAVGTVAVEGVQGISHPILLQISVMMESHSPCEGREEE